MSFQSNLLYKKLDLRWHIMCFPLVLECDSSSDNRLGGSGLLKFALWSYHVNPGRFWSSINLPKVDMPHFWLLRSVRIGPHCCHFDLLLLYPSWHSWTIHCHKKSPALNIAISTVMLLEFSLPRKLSTVFSDCLNSSQAPESELVPLPSKVFSDYPGSNW